MFWWATKIDGSREWKSTPKMGCMKFRAGTIGGIRIGDQIAVRLAMMHTIDANTNAKAKEARGRDKTSTNRQRLYVLIHRMLAPF